MSQLRPEITKIRVCTFQMSGKIPDSSKTSPGAPLFVDISKNVGFRRRQASFTLPRVRSMRPVCVETFLRWICPICVGCWLLQPSFVRRIPFCFACCFFALDVPHLHCMWPICVVCCCFALYAPCLRCMFSICFVRARSEAPLFEHWAPNSAIGRPGEPRPHGNAF